MPRGAPAEEARSCFRRTAPCAPLLGRLGHGGAIRGAAALALATVFALTAVVAGLAASLALAIVLAFARVLGGGRVHPFVPLAGVDELGRSRLHGGLGGRVRRHRGSTDQAGESRRQEHCIQLVLHGE